MQPRSWMVSVVVMLLAAGAARAAQPRIVFVPGCGVTAGEVVTVGWQGLPSDAEEFEFLLSTGGGELIRLTPELSPADGSFRWTIPDLPSREAVLTLRARIDGEEVVLTSSEPFVIRAAAGRARVEFRDREWWMVPPAPLAAAPVGIHLVRHRHASKPFVRTRNSVVHAAPLLVRERQDGAHRLSPGTIDTHRGAPLSVPLRI